MTEILFGFVLILTLYFFFSERYIASVVVISFIPFARSEGYLMIFFLFLALLMQRRFKAIPFLATGFALFSVIGSFYYKDILWVINKFPYPVNHPIYHTHGNFWKFFSKPDLNYGFPVLILIYLGIVKLIFDCITGDPVKKKRAWEIILFFLMPSLAYYFFHSILYYKAWGGSVGLFRVITGVVPLIAVVAMYGLSVFSFLNRLNKWVYPSFLNRLNKWVNPSFLNKLNKWVYPSFLNRLNKWVYPSFLVIITVLIVIYAFRTTTIPVPLGPEEKLVKKTVNWITANQNPLPLIVYNDHNVPYFLDIDPNDGTLSRQAYKLKAIRSMPWNSLLIWDAHFGPNECSIPLDSVMKDPHMRLIRIFRPNIPFQTFGGYDYAVYVFLKEQDVNISDNYLLLQTRINEDDSSFNPVLRKVFDFEKASASTKSHLDSTVAVSGKKSYRFDATTNYSPGLFLHYREILAYPLKIRIKATVDMYSRIPYKDNTTLVVVSLEDKKQSYFYQAFRAEKAGFSPGIWNRASITTDLPPVRSKDDMIKVYVWHPGDNILFIDDLEVDILAKTFDEYSASSD